MTFEGVTFVDSWVKSKSEEDFIKESSHHGLSEKQLKEAYRIICPKQKASANSQQSTERGKQS